MERLIAVIAVVLLVSAGAVAVDDSTRRSSDRQLVQNETFDADGNSYVELNNSNREGVYYDNSVDVYTSDDGVIADGNYTWNAGNGTIFVQNGSYLDNQSNTSVTYGYSRPDQTQRQLASLAGDGLDVAQLLILVLAAGLVLAATRVFGRL